MQCARYKNIAIWKKMYQSVTDHWLYGLYAYESYLANGFSMTAVLMKMQM